MMAAENIHCYSATTQPAAAWPAAALRLHCSHSTIKGRPACKPLATLELNNRCDNITRKLQVAVPTGAVMYWDTPET
jgi:hypothetical protein